MKLLAVLAAFVAADTHVDPLELIAEIGAEVSAVDLLAALSIEDDPVVEPKVTEPVEE